MSFRATASIAATLVLAAGGALYAQRGGSRADSLLRDGAVERAESMYYAAVRAQPRNPEARWELGRYLISRGALRVGATLIEEAMRFGLDSAVGAAALAPVYLQIGQTQALAALPAAALGVSERARARWLVDHPSRAIAPDTLIAVAYQPSTGGAIGTVALRLNGRTIDATIDAHARGLVVSDAAASSVQLRRFSSGSASTRGMPAVVDSLGIGRLSIANVPVTIASDISAPVMIGLDAFGPYAPTFDPRARRVLLHPTGVSSAAAPDATVLQTLSVEGDLLVARGGGWASLTSPMLGSLLRDHRWTVDARRGRIIVEP